MQLKDFIKENRESIDDVIRASGGRQFNDEEREDWIMNDEGLYNWARREGCKI